jgi:tripartite ATP-independent transporter DctM subunit
MDPVILGLLALLVMLAAIALGLPIGMALLAAGAAGLWAVEGLNTAEAQLFLNFYDRGTAFVLTAIPLYLLMGQLVFKTRIASDLYDCVYKWFGWLPGGLAIASVNACAGFGAVSGGSATAVATLGPMCMPEMRKYNYSNRLAAGSVASAGTLGILIPPSIFLIVYGVWTETSVAELFIAGIVPGVIMTIAFSLTILVLCLRNRELGPAGPAFPWRERFASLVKLAPVAAIFVLVIGGIYGGVFDPSEAAAIGVAGIVVIAAVMGRLTFEAVKSSLLSTLHTSAMIFLIIIGGHVLGRFVVLTDLTSTIVDLIAGLGLHPLVLIALFSLMYVVLGMILDIWAMLILTVPFVFPVIVAQNMDPVWFGIYVIMMSELAAITPPIGVNVYVMAKVAPDVPLAEIFRGVAPFFITALAVIALLSLFPEIVTWLPNLAFDRNLDA